jgi:hypothetical protein
MFQTLYSSGKGTQVQPGLPCQSQSLYERSFFFVKKRDLLTPAACNAVALSVFLRRISLVPSAKPKQANFSLQTPISCWVRRRRRRRRRRTTTTTSTTRKKKKPNTDERSPRPPVSRETQPIQRLTLSCLCSIARNTSDVYIKDDV